MVGCNWADDRAKKKGSSCRLQFYSNWAKADVSQTPQKGNMVGYLEKDATKEASLK